MMTELVELERVDHDCVEGKEESAIIKTQHSVTFSRQLSALDSFATQCKFEWKDVDVYVGNDIDGKHILHNSNGTIESGELLAVMGGSGSGKSTLVNALSGRSNLNQQRVNGYLAINGEKLKCSNQKIIKSLCTVVPQSDQLCETQTVQEALTFYAALKLSHYCHEKQEKRINYLINVLHLNECRNSYIVNISGGEKRRVSIAAEILNDHKIIFLDEPTSGLDAYTAAKTIKTLKQFCSVSNKIIIATIHQPSMQVFYLFDKLIVLSNGKCCFNSDINDIDIYFKDNIDFAPRINPADIIIFETQINPNKYAEKWNTSQYNISADCSWNNYNEFVVNKNEAYGNHKSAPQKLQYWLLFKRELQSSIRNKREIIVRWIQVVCFAITTGLCYYNVVEKYSERARAFFLLTFISVFFGIVSLLTAFPGQKSLFQREYNSGTYNITPWAASFVIIEIPREIIHMMVFTLIAYYMLGLAGNIFQYWFSLFLISITGGSFGILFGTICKSTIEGAQFTPFALIPLLIFCDGFIRVETLPALMRWLVYINPLYYLIRCFYIIEFYGQVYNYPRVDDPDGNIQKACDSYQMFLNVTSGVFVDLNKFNSTSTIDSVCSNICNMNHNHNQSILQEFGFNSTNLVEDLKSEYGWDNITTTQSAHQDKIDLYCATEVHWETFFELKHLDENAVLRYWLIVILICFILRVMSLLLLLAINNNVFSWIYKKMNTSIKCLCRCFKGKNVKSDDINNKINQ